MTCCKRPIHILPWGHFQRLFLNSEFQAIPFQIGRFLGDHFNKYDVMAPNIPALNLATSTMLLGMLRSRILQGVEVMCLALSSVVTPTARFKLVTHVVGCVHHSRHEQGSLLCGPGAAP